MGEFRGEVGEVRGDEEDDDEADDTGSGGRKIFGSTKKQMLKIVRVLPYLFILSLPQNPCFFTYPQFQSQLAEFQVLIFHEKLQRVYAKHA